MIWRRLAIALLLLAPVSASAYWQSRDQSFVSGAAYIGPGDIVSGATAWYGLRCYAAANASAAQAINIRRASDNTTQDVGLTASCDLVDVSAGFCAGTTCYVTKWYDQSGNGKNITQTTAASQPQLIFSALGSRPMMTFSGGQQILTPSNSTFPAGPNSWSALAERTGATTSYNTLAQVAGSSVAQLGYNNTTNTAFVGNATITATASDSAYHAIQGIENGASPASILNIDGTETTGTTGAISGGTTGLYVGVNGGAASYMNGNMGELGLWPVAFTSGNRSSMHSNQSAYWGTP